MRVFNKQLFAKAFASSNSSLHEFRSINSASLCYPTAKYKHLTQYTKGYSSSATFADSYKPIFKKVFLGSVFAVGCSGAVYYFLDREERIKALITAAERGDIGYLSNYLAFLGDINVKDEYGNTPLHVAVAYGKYATVDFLLRHGALVNEKNNQGETPLIFAAEKGDAQIVKLLVQNKANVNAANNKGDSALTLAVQNHNIAAAEVLISTNKASNKNRVDVNFANSNGDTPLILAVKAKSVLLVSKLLACYNIDPDIKNNKGHTALIEAVIAGELKVVASLIASEKIDLLQTDDAGYNALLVAIKHFNLKVGKFLAETGKFIQNPQEIDDLAEVLRYSTHRRKKDKQFDELFEFLNSLSKDELSQRVDKIVANDKLIKIELEQMKVGSSGRSFEGEVADAKDQLE